MSYIGVKYHCCAHDCRYEFRETVNPPGCTTAKRKPIAVREDYRCPECGHPMGWTLTVDHWDDDGSEG